MVGYIVHDGKNTLGNCFAGYDNIYHPSGDERTYPNILAREYCWANQDHRDAFQPVTATTVSTKGGHGRQI